MTTPTPEPTASPKPTAPSRWERLLGHPATTALAALILVILLGIVAMGTPFVAGVAVTLTVGIILIAVAVGVVAMAVMRFGRRYTCPLPCGVVHVAHRSTTVRKDP